MHSLAVTATEVTKGRTLLLSLLSPSPKQKRGRKIVEINHERNGHER
jgi:hypothetical protein